MFIDSLKTTLKSMMENRQPTFVSGPAGVGKSSIVQQIAAEFTEELGETFHHVDVRLTQMEPSDLRGILYPNSKTGKAIWLPPAMLPSDPDWMGVIVFDELTSAPPLIQAAAYQLFLDRRIGDYYLPEGAVLIAAGNNANDRGVFFRMAAPLANRMIHLKLEVSLEKWKPWAYNNGIDKSILGFLSFKEDCIHKFDPASKDAAFPSPRTWEFASNILSFDLPDYEKREAILGCVGEGVGTDFWAYRSLLDGVVSIDTILNPDKDYSIPEKDISIIYGINSAIIHRFRNSTPSSVEILQLFKYMEKIGMDEVRANTYREFTSEKIRGLIGSTNKEIKEAFAKFYDKIEAYIPN